VNCGRFRAEAFVADDLAHMAEEQLVILPLLHALYPGSSEASLNPSFRPC